MNFNINGCDCVLSGIPLKDSLVSVEITPEGDAYSDDIGADGTVCRYATNERRATANIVLKGFSKEHAKLTALHAADVSSTNGAGITSFLFKDNNGSTLVSTDKAWIMGMPAKTSGQKPEDVTWKVRLVLSSPLNWIVGGN